ncbi:unnamed protein product [marine sediment metagenome]|uniref:Uncharacterized protein n=1 Tax=marine sediment metagenome TaxID=412755 RepID=X0SPP2_9ZZZZ
MKNGYPATWVRCPKCGTKIFREEEYNTDYCINIQLRLELDNASFHSKLLAHSLANVHPHSI